MINILFRKETALDINIVPSKSRGLMRLKTDAPKQEKEGKPAE